MTECAQCEYHKERAGLWREAAYKASGYALPDREDMVLVPIADLKDLLHDAELASEKTSIWDIEPHLERIREAMRKMIGENHD
jgi:hypothetical protein